MMNPDQDNENIIKQHNTKETINTLNIINYQVAELLRIKEELEEKLLHLFEHSDDSSKTYVFEKWKTTLTTGYNYTLDKDEYLIMKTHLRINPVKERVAYDVDKKIIKDCERYGNEEDLALINQIITKKPKKLHVKIAAAT